MLICAHWEEFQENIRIAIDIEADKEYTYKEFMELVAICSQADIYIKGIAISSRRYSHTQAFEHQHAN